MERDIYTSMCELGGNGVVILRVETLQPHRTFLCRSKTLDLLSRYYLPTYLYTEVYKVYTYTTLEAPGAPLSAYVHIAGRVYIYRKYRTCFECVKYILYTPGTVYFVEYHFRLRKGKCEAALTG